MAWAGPTAGEDGDMSDKAESAHLDSLRDAINKQLPTANAVHDEKTGTLIVLGVQVEGMIAQHRDTLTVSDGTTPFDYRPRAATGTHNFASAARRLIAYAERKRSGLPIIVKRQMTTAEKEARDKYLTEHNRRVLAAMREPRGNPGQRNRDSVYGKRLALDKKLP